MFKITSIQTKKVEKEGSKLLGFARVIIDDCFVINNLKIIQGSAERGLFVAFPNRKQENGNFKDLCHPMKQTCRDMFEKAIIEEFSKESNS